MEVNIIQHSLQFYYQLWIDSKSYELKQHMCMYRVRVCVCVCESETQSEWASHIIEL